MKLFPLSLLAPLLILSLALPPAAVRAEHAATVGYGFGFLNPNKRTLHIEGGRLYDFFQATYLYERPCHYPKVAILFEPFVAYINRPTDGVDFGFNSGIKWYPFNPAQGLYLSPQVGMAYTTIGFKEQGTHLLFILQAAVGYRHGNLFVENRFKHYSNGRTASPNRSVHSNIIAVGMYF
jgi:hypothetical protein